LIGVNGLAGYYFDLKSVHRFFYCVIKLFGRWVCQQWEKSGVLMSIIKSSNLIFSTLRAVLIFFSGWTDEPWHVKPVQVEELARFSWYLFRPVWELLAIDHGLRLRFKYNDLRANW